MTTDSSVAVLAAMPRELRRLARALALPAAPVGGRPGWRSSRILVGAVGVGAEAASAATARVLADHRPTEVLIIGVAGAVDDDLAVAEVIAPSRVVDAATGVAWTPHGGGREATARPRTLATVQRLGAPLPEGTSAVDMETAAIAAQCERLGVPWDVRRAISDLPGTVRSTVAALVGADGTADLPAVARFVARDPRQLGVLRRLARDSARAISAVTASALAELRAADLGIQ